MTNPGATDEEKTKPGSKRTQNIKRFFAKFKETKCGWVKNIYLMHYMILLLHVIAMWEIQRITFPDLQRMDESRAASQESSTWGTRIEKTVIALLMVGLAIYFGVAYEMLRKKRSYTETFGAVINPMKPHRILIVVAFFLVFSRLPMAVPFVNDEVTIWIILTTTGFTILSILMVQIYAVTVLDTSLLMSLIAFIYDLIVFEYCFAFVLYFMSFDTSDGEGSWYENLKKNCAKKNKGRHIDCDTLREERDQISFYFVVVTVTTAGFGDITTQKPSERVVILVMIVFFTFFNSLLFSYIYALLSSRNQFKIEIRNKYLIVQDYLKRRYYFDDLKRNIQLNYYLLNESRADNIVDAFVPNDHAEGYKALCKQAYKDPVHVSKLPAVTEMKKTGYLESSTAVQFLLLVGACLFIQFFHALMVKCSKEDDLTQFDVEYFVVVAGLSLGFGDITPTKIQGIQITTSILILGNLFITWATLQLSSLKLNEDRLLINYNEKIMQVKNAMIDLTEDIRREKDRRKKEGRKDSDPNRVRVDFDKQNDVQPMGGEQRDEQGAMDDYDDGEAEAETDQMRFNRIMGFFRLRWLLNQDLNISPGHICEFMADDLFYDCNRDIVEMLARINYLNPLMNTSSRIPLLRNMEIVVFAPNEVVIKEGNFDSSMYLLLHGLVCQKTAIEKKWDDNLQQDLLEGGNLVSVGSRRVFGMPGFFTDCRQLETIIAMTTTEMAKISRDRVVFTLENFKRARMMRERKEQATWKYVLSKRGPPDMKGRKELMGGFINDDLFKEDAAVFREEIDIRQLRSQFEVKVNRKMEPIERLAATNLDKESSAAQKRLVPMVILIIILRIFLIVLTCARLSFWYRFVREVGSVVLLLRLFLIFEMLFLKTARGITFESVKTRKTESALYYNDWEFISSIILVLFDGRTMVAGNIGIPETFMTIFNMFLNYRKMNLLLDTFMFLRSDHIAEINIMRVINSILLSHYNLACLMYALACPTVICNWNSIRQCWLVKGDVDRYKLSNTSVAQPLVYSDVYFINANLIGGTPTPSDIRLGRTSTDMTFIEGKEWVYNQDRFWDVDKNVYTVFYEGFNDPESSIAKRLLICLYYVTMVTTTTGFGEMVPQTPIEKLITLGMCLWGIIFYSIVTAQITSYLINIVGTQFEWRQRMYVREKHLQWHKVQKTKINQMKQLYNYIWRMTRGKNITDLVNELNPYERGRLCHRLYVNYLRLIPELSKVTSEGMKRIAVEVRQIHVAKDTVIFHHWDIISEIFILQNGQAQILKSGTSLEEKFGERRDSFRGGQPEYGEGEGEAEDDAQMINKMQLINRFTPKDTDAESNNKKEGGRKRAEPDDDFPKYTKLAEYTVKATKDCQILLIPFTAIQKEFQNLPQKERQRVLTAVKKRFKSSTEGPPPAKKRKKESGDYDTPDAGGDNKSNKDADGKPKEPDYEGMDFFEMMERENEKQREKEAKAEEKRRKKEEKKKRETGGGQTSGSDISTVSASESSSGSEEDEDEDEDDLMKDGEDIDKEDMSEEKRSKFQVIRSNSRNMFWLLILTKFVCAFLLIVSPLHFVLNGRELWINIITLCCCIYLFFELILVEPYFVAKSPCANAFRYIVQAISCVPIEIIQTYTEPGDRSQESFLIYQILVLIYGFLFRVCWILFRIVKDLDYGLKMFLSKSTILSLVWTVLNVAVYTHWMTISWMFITCFTWLKVCSMDTMIGTQTNYPFLVTNGEEKENARLLIYQGILHYVIVMTTTVGYGDMYSTTYYEMILTILMSIGSKMFYSNVMGDMSSLFTFNINSKNNFMQMTKRLKEEMQHLPFPRSDTEGKDKLTMDDVKNAKDIDDKMALNELVDTELKEDTPQKIERYCILGYNFSNGYVIDDLFNDTPLLMNAEEKRDMYRAFLIQVMKFPTLSEKLLEVKNIAQQKADAAGVIDEKGKRKREKDLVLAIQRQVALRVQEHSLMVTQDFVIKNRIRDGSKAAQPHIYAMAKRGAFSKVMGKVKKGRHRQQTENEEGEVLREERVRNKTWKVEVPANEILGPGDYVVKTTCLALVLVHDDAFAVLNKYEALVKGEDEE